MIGNLGSTALSIPQAVTFLAQGKYTESTEATLADAIEKASNNPVEHVCAGQTARGVQPVSVSAEGHGPSS